MEKLLGAFFGFFFAILAVVLVIYILQAIFLNKFHKLVYVKGTVAAWFPISNLYVLGKLTFNKTVGWILVVISLLSSEITTTVNGVEKSYSLMPDALSSIFSIGIFALYIYAIVKYFNVKKANSILNIDVSNVNMQQSNQSVQPNVVVNNQEQSTISGESNLNVNQNIDNSVNSIDSNNNNSIQL